MGETVVKRRRAEGPEETAKAPEPGSAAGPVPGPGPTGAPDARREGAVADDLAQEEGTWIDTYALHFPPHAAAGRTFDRGVGFEGYDRGTGAAVPKHPRLVRSGDEEAEADPFEGGGDGAAEPD